MNRSREAPDVVIVGGGAIGTATAFEVAQAGGRVLLLEAGPRLADGCSYGNAGLIRVSHSSPLATPTALRNGLRWMLRRDSPFYLRPRPRVLPWLLRFASACTEERVRRSSRIIRRLSTHGRDLHAAYARDGLDTGFEPTGVLDLCVAPEALERATRQAARDREDGLRNSLLDVPAVKALVPTAPDDIAGGILYPDDAHCNPFRFVQAVGEAATRAGVDVRPGARVTELRAEHGRVAALQAGGNTIHPGVVVIAAGAWSPGLLRRLGIALPVEAGKGYHLDLAGMDVDPRVPVMMEEFRVIATPLHDTLRFAGTLELSGLDLAIDPIRVEAIFRAAARMFRHVARSRVVETWAGLRPCSPDGLPIIGSPSGWDNLILATGHGMSGLQLAPITGRLVRQLVMKEAPTLDLAPLSPDRFRRWPGHSPARTAVEPSTAS